MSMNRWLLWTYVAMSLNLSALMTVSWGRRLAPVESVILAPQMDGFVVSGRNRLGLSTIHVFKSWQDVELFLAKNSLSLPVLTHAQIGMGDSVALRLPATSSQIGISVLFDSTKAQSPLVKTPDIESAKVFAEYLQYQGLSPSQLGYALELSSN